jgi:hypothetical protein
MAGRLSTHCLHCRMASVCPSCMLNLLCQGRVAGRAAPGKGAPGHFLHNGPQVHLVSAARRASSIRASLCQAPPGTALLMLYMLLYLMLYMLLYMLLYQLLYKSCCCMYLLRYLRLVRSTVRLVLRRRVVQLVITSDQSHAQGSHSIERWSQPKVKQLLHSAELPGRVVTRGSAPFNPSAPIILIFPGGCAQEETLCSALHN